MVLWAACHGAWAVNDPLPEQMQFRDFPAGAKLLVTKDLTLPHGEGDEFGGSIGGKEIHLIGDKTGSGLLRAGETFRLDDVSCHKSQEETFCSIRTLRRADGGAYVFLLFPDVTNAFAFSVRRNFKASLDVVWDDPNGDPYRGMDPAIALDVMMKKITSSMEAGAPEKALPEFARIEKLGRPLPESFYYYYAEACSKAGREAEAKERARHYLNTYGRGGKYYAKAVDLLAK